MLVNNRRKHFTYIAHILRVRQHKWWTVIPNNIHNILHYVQSNENDFIFILMIERIFFLCLSTVVHHMNIFGVSFLLLWHALNKMENEWTSKAPKGMTKKKIPNAHECQWHLPTLNNILFFFRSIWSPSIRFASFDIIKIISGMSGSFDNSVRFWNSFLFIWVWKSVLYFR